MKVFDLFRDGEVAAVVCEDPAPGGVKRVAGIVAGDLLLVTGERPGIYSSPEDCPDGSAVFIATVGCGEFVNLLSERGIISVAGIDGKRECYMMCIREKPFAECPQIKQALFIVGSDKRGTIYGMFRLSEMCGVSPLVFWGDAAPTKKDTLRIKLSGDVVSKEPSVKYRGFFINDEWPAFGKWCTERFGGVNAKAYDMVFQLLLRLKGNYLWPAMWNSSFSEDGPGLENARLADEYGVIMGASHHEPMCRAGVEWQRQYAKYGNSNEWDFNTNGEAITEFWKDGILRNKDFENIITIGMRGENDSLLMGEGAGIQDNVDVLKRAISVQNRLLREHLGPELKQIPRMFAIYKEVEDFYFGVDGCEGLRGWEELEDVILLFSEDNHGSLRAIPGIDEQMHSGGYGIYYHFDYHGSPYSYEWLNHINPVRAWEQLTKAYEHGIREMWIVNVGDIKGNEYPLSYFMELAYDYDTWGVSNIDSALEYTGKWIDTQFGKAINGKAKKKIHDILFSYIKWSALRIPESMNPEVFKNNFGELERTLSAAVNVMSKAHTLQSALPSQCLEGYNSMVFYPVMAFFSAMMVNIIAALNLTHARRGALVANIYAKELKYAIDGDRHYINEFHSFLGGKWNHMMDSAHMCFRTWDDNDWTYPPAQIVSPIPYPKIIVSFRGYDIHSLGHHWQDAAPICGTQMTRPDVDEITLDIDSRGDVDFSYKISCGKPWLTFSKTSGKSNLKSAPQTSVKAFCARDKLNGTDIAAVRIDFKFADKDKTEKQAFLNIKASNVDGKLPSGVFLESQDYLCIKAENFSEVSDVGGMGWRVVAKLGREGGAIKSFPVTKNWIDEKDRPYVRYDFIVSTAREHVITFYLSPRNPAVKGGVIKGCYSLDEGAPQLFDVVRPGFTVYHTDDDWSYGTVNNIRKVSVRAFLNQGLNSLRFYAADPGIILEHIVIYPKDIPIPGTHLAPPESYRAGDNK